jgi:hypothetical protein
MKKGHTFPRINEISNFFVVFSTFMMNGKYRGDRKVVKKAAQIRKKVDNHTH